MSDKIYCYSDSDILRNKLGIRDREELLTAEIEFTSLRLVGLLQSPIEGSYGFAHLCAIHGYIFQDLYSWAGQVRTVDIAKGSLFCLVRHIPGYAASIFPAYYRECRAARGDKEQFVHVLASYYADLNALHPFREGNGRTQREYTREICLACGYLFDLSHTCHEEMLAASIASFNGDNRELERVFQASVRRVDHAGREVIYSNFLH